MGLWGRARTWAISLLLGMAAACEWSSRPDRIIVLGLDGLDRWWATWPAPRVNEVMVSDHTCYHFLFLQAAPGTESPPA